MKKIVVIYYSWSNGNTKRIAEQLSRETGADLVRIDTVKPYEGSHDDVVAQGHREVNEGLLWSSFFVTLVAKKYRLATMLPFVPRMVCDSR